MHEQKHTPVAIAARYSLKGHLLALLMLALLIVVSAWCMLPITNI
jgi:hypothetical protein